MSAVVEAISELRVKYEKLDAQAKREHVEMERFTNEALVRHKAETGELAPAPGSELFEQLKGARAKFAAVRQEADTVRAQIDQLASVVDAGAYSHEDVRGAREQEAAGRFAKSLGDRIVASDRYRELQTRLAGAAGDSHPAIEAAMGTKRFSLGALMSRGEWLQALTGGGMSPRATTITGGGATSAGPFVVNDLQPGYVPYLRKRPVMLGLVGRGQTDSDTVEFVRQTAVSSAAAETAENSVSPESTIAFETVTTQVKEIPHFVPVTRRALADAGQLRTIVEQDLLDGVVDRIDTQIASGNGSGENLTGIYNTSTILTFAKGAYSAADALLHLITLLSIQAGVLSEPDAIGMYPSDWEALRMAKDVNGQYLMGPPNIPGPKSAFGTPIETSTVFTNGTPIGGLFGRFARYWVREAPTVYVGLDGNDFTYRRMTILAEARGAFAVQRPTGFCTITGY